jgi:uncharacterized membrane protein HdeD (DUF308 family)
MRILQSSIFRSVVALIVGVLLIKYSEEAVKWLTVCIGLLFLVSGLISCITYFAAKRRDPDTEVFDAQGRRMTMPAPSFPIVGIGSIVLGALLALMPSAFVHGLMYVLAAILILGALNQYFNLGAVTRIARVGCFWWVFPSIILLVGLIAIVKPDLIAGAPLYIIGWCMLVYGVVDLIDAIKIHQVRKAFEQSYQEINDNDQEPLSADADNAEEAATEDASETDEPTDGDTTKD